MISACHWCLKTLTAFIRSNAEFAAWAGKDTLGNARFYIGEGPPAHVLAADLTVYSYAVAAILPSPRPEWTTHTKEQELLVRVSFVAKSNGRAKVLLGDELFTRMFEPRRSGQLLGDGWVSATVEEMSGLSEPEELDQEFLAYRDWRIRAVRTL